MQSIDYFPIGDLKIEAYPPRTGGQQVGSTSCGVRIEHLPSGLIAISNTERSQIKNRAIAADMILAGLTSSKR